METQQMREELMEKIAKLVYEYEEKGGDDEHGTPHYSTGVDIFFQGEGGDPKYIVKNGWCPRFSLGEEGFEYNPLPSNYNG